MRKLNGKNKIYIAIFSIIIFLIIGILVFALTLSQKKLKTVYNVSSNSVVFDSDTNLIDTSSGGEVAKKWDDAYYYIDSNDISYKLGNTSVIYEKSKDEIQIFGDNHQVYLNGSIVKNNDITVVSDINKTSFYKLSDRVYLIISAEIYNKDKSIFTSKYLIVYIDKKGNASVLNDSVNIKTINPMSLVFDDYTFDIANEKLMIKDEKIDLKQINGSTNEYVPKEEKGDDVKTEVNVDMKDFVNKYNNLVNSFQQYTENTVLSVGSNQQVTNNNNFIVTDDSDDSGSASTGPNKVQNSLNIMKKVSLRGAVSYPSYIDVSYVVTDLEDKYQAVYLLVTGVIDDVQTTEKIILDKYATSYRINGLSPKHEYSISLGYVERIKGIDGNYTASDVVEDVINVRTTKSDVKLTIDKVSKGYVYFNLKMTKNYALESGYISLYSDNVFLSKIAIDTKQALSDSGFSSKIPLSDGTLMELKLENAIYSGKEVDLNVKKKFIY